MPNFCLFLLQCFLQLLIVAFGGVPASQLHYIAITDLAIYSLCNRSFRMDSTACLITAQLSSEVFLHFSKMLLLT